MARWEVIFDLDASGPAPVYRQIAQVIVEEAGRGRLRPGERLPSTRSLATQLGVHRNTVIAAYQELEAQGWLSGAPGRATFLNEVFPLSPPTPRPLNEAGFSLGPSLPDDPRHRRPGLLRLFGGVPELRFVPHTALARALRQALRGAEGRRLLDYGDPRGDHRLRAALAELLSRTRGLTIDAESLLITQGAQQAVYLAARALLAPGDRVAVEAWSFPNGCQALRLAGAELVPIPLDGQGLDVAALERAQMQGGLRGVMLTPHHQYPTTVTLSPSRREQLLALARRHRWLVLEDDVDHEFHYDGPPVLPLAAKDQGGNVLYVGTTSKVLAPGLRLGYLTGPRAALERIARYRIYVDSEGAHLNERAVALLLEDGLVQRHVRRARGLYRQRRDHLVDVLHRTLPQLEFQVPAGGLAIWAAAPEIDVEAWLTLAIEGGVAFHTARRFAVDGEAAPFVRLGFGALDPEELSTAVARMAQALAKLTRPRRSR